MRAPMNRRSWMLQTDSAYVQILRPRQWVKNGFVFAAPIFGGAVFSAEGFAAAFLAFLGFCLLSGAVYVLNDWADLAEDRAHPEKCKRPLAAGVLAVWKAGLWGAATGGTGLVLLWWCGGLTTLLTGAAFLLLNALYSLWLKHLVILDVLAIGASFLLRVLGGAAAVGIMPSYWLLLCAGNISLFLAFVKRRGEIVQHGESAARHRAVLEHYSIGFLDQMVSVATSSTIVCYTLYTVDERTVAVFGTRLLVATAPIVVYGLFRYLFLTYHRRGGSNPSELVVRDLGILISVVLWGICSIAIIYKGRDISAWMRHMGF